MNRKFFSLGLMSGTSLDGVDASIINSDGEGFIDLIDDIYIKYDENLRLSIDRIIKLNFINRFIIMLINTSCNNWFIIRFIMYLYDGRFCMVKGFN